MAWRDIVNVPRQIVTGFQEAAGIRPMTAAEIVAPFTTPEKAAQSAAGTAVPMGITGAFAPPAKDVVSLTSVAPVTATTPATPRPQATVAPQVTTAPVAATPDTRPAPTADQGMNWAKAAQDAVKGFGVTPRGQGVPTMEERGLVRDAQGRWVPSEALQQAVEANYQAGVAARNPVVQAPVAATSDTAGVTTIKRPAISAFDMSFVGAANMSNPSFRNAIVAKEEYAMQNAAAEADRRASEKQQELGLRGGALGVQQEELSFRKEAENAKRGLQEKELALRASEAPSMRALREAQTQQAIAEAGLTSEKKRLYPETIRQSQAAAEAKAQGATIAKLQDNILRLRRDLSKAVMPEEKAATQKLIKDQEFLLSQAML